MIVMLLVVYPRLSAGALVGTDLSQAVPLVAAASLGHLLFGDVQPEPHDVAARGQCARGVHRRQGLRPGARSPDQADAHPRAGRIRAEAALGPRRRSPSPPSRCSASSRSRAVSLATSDELVPRSQAMHHPHARSAREVTESHVAPRPLGGGARSCSRQIAAPRSRDPQRKRRRRTTASSRGPRSAMLASDRLTARSTTVSARHAARKSPDAPGPHGDPPRSARRRRSCRAPWQHADGPVLSSTSEPRTGPGHFATSAATRQQVHVPASHPALLPRTQEPPHS